MRLGASTDWIVIEPPGRGMRLDLRELWRSRDLIMFLAWRDVAVRYKQTVLGVIWAILQPLATMLVFTLIFGKMIAVPSEGIPYPIFSFAGLLPWQLFTSALANVSSSVVGSAHLVSKVYFPRLVIPIAGVLPALIDFGIALLMLIGMMWYYGIVIGGNVVWLPLVLLPLLATVLGAGLWLAALNVQYRDIRHAVPLLLQLLLFVSPVAYPSRLVPERWRLAYELNPMVGVIEGFRWALLGTTADPRWELALAAGVSGGLLVSGLMYFQRTEARFADLV